MMQVCKGIPCVVIKWYHASVQTVTSCEATLKDPGVGCLGLIIQKSFGESERQWLKSFQKRCTEQFGCVKIGEPGKLWLSFWFPLKEAFKNVIPTTHGVFFAFVGASGS